MNCLLQKDPSKIEKEWAVELEDIGAFVDKYGQCVVGRDIDGFCTIEIYDDYRE